jgi:hypothetical protein
VSYRAEKTHTHCKEKCKEKKENKMLSLLFFITFSSSITPPTKKERERDKETHTTLQQ